MNPLKLAACALLAAAVCGAQPKHVVLITLDGGGAFFLDDQSLRLPNLRRLIHDGVRAESSESVYPSVTHPAHTSIITGVSPIRHGVLSNSTYDHDTGRSAPPNSLPHSQVVLARTIFDTAKAKGLSTAGILWPETIEDPSLDYDLTIRTQGKERHIQGEALDPELRADNVPVDLLNRLADKTISLDTVDTIVTLAAVDVIEKHRPDLIAIHLVNLDFEEHQFGPDDIMAKAAIMQEDSDIGLIVQAVRKAGIYDETAFIVTADHGFANIHYQMNIRPYFKRAGLLGKVRLRHPGWSCFIELLPGFDPKTDNTKLQSAFAELRKNPHILRILNSDQFPELGYPRYEDSKRVPGQYLIIPDIDTLLRDSPGDSMELQRLAVVAHEHGYLPQYPAMYPLLVLSGNGFKKGVRIGHVRSLDLAPTISYLLGLPPLPCEGRVLREALEK